MNQPDIDEILARTLDDKRLSRGEKHVLREIVDELAGNQHELAVIRNKAFAQAKAALQGELAGEVLDWLADVVGILDSASQGDGGRATAVFFSDQHECPATIASLIDRCSARLDICVYTITDDRISAAILDAHGRGVAVRIVTDDEKVEATGSDIAAFIRAGIAVRTDDNGAYMHHKFAVFDQRSVLTGSYNWTRGAAGANQENFIVTSERDVVAAFVETFDRLWARYDPAAPTAERH